MKVDYSKFERGLNLHGKIVIEEEVQAYSFWVQKITEANVQYHHASLHMRGRN